MKKIFTLLALFSLLQFSKAQSLQAWTLDASGTTTVFALPNGAAVSYTTSASNPTITSTTEVDVKFKNISASTCTYSVIRKDLVLNPGAKAHFCFGDLGSCYDETVLEPSSDFCVLAPGDSTTGGRHLVTELDEANTVGYSAVYYKLFNKTTGKNGADTLSFTIKYNQFSGIEEKEKSLVFTGDIFPNPVSGKARIIISLAHESNVKISVSDALGKSVYEGEEQTLAGENKLSVDCSQLNAGLYFITVTAGNSRITKRLVVNN